MPDDDFYNTIGAFRVASEPPNWLIAQHSMPPKNDTTFKFHDDGSFELRDTPLDSEPQK